jgi:hypothetical protein
MTLYILIMNFQIPLVGEKNLGKSNNFLDLGLEPSVPPGSKLHMAGEQLNFRG